MNRVDELIKMHGHAVEVTYTDGKTRVVIPLGIDWAAYEEDQCYACRCLDPTTGGYLDILHQEIASIRKPVK